MTLHSLASVEEPYKRQMTSYRRTRSAILEGTKSLIATVGLQHTNMIDIADTSQVSRATLYNHFRDKGSVVRALLESEVDRLFLSVDSDLAFSEILMAISIQISTDNALATMRKTDASALAQLLMNPDDILWHHVDSGLRRLLKDETAAEIARLWLVGQVMQPLTEKQIQVHSQRLASLSESATREKL